MAHGNHKRRERAPRFGQHRWISAKFYAVGACGHQVSPGDNVLWAPGHTLCTECSEAWTAENAEAARLEAVSR